MKWIKAIERLPEKNWSGSFKYTDSDITKYYGGQFIAGSWTGFISPGTNFDTKLFQFIEWLDEDAEDEEKNLFAISFAVWLKGAEGQMYEATGMSAGELLRKYKDRPYIDTFNPEKQ